MTVKWNDNPMGWDNAFMSHFGKIGNQEIEIFNDGMVSFEKENADRTFTTMEMTIAEMREIVKVFDEWKAASPKWVKETAK